MNTFGHCFHFLMKSGPPPSTFAKATADKSGRESPPSLYELWRTGRRCWQKNQCQISGLKAVVGQAGAKKPGRSEISISKRSGLEYFDPLVPVDIQKVLISTADDFCIGGQCTSDKLVVIRIGANRFSKLT